MVGNLEVKGTEHRFSLLGQTFVLHSSRSIFWEEESILILSDIHLGKAGHFRKHGIPVPRQVHISDLQRINSLIEKYQPTKVLFLGDLFHSDQNEEWEDFAHWSGHHAHAGIGQVLVLGNHDILEEQQYHDLGVKLCAEYVAGPFEFTHESRPSVRYNISGHVHPSIRLHGTARQGATLACFFFGRSHALLPAFGGFTGSHPIRASKGDQIFAIAEDLLIGLVG